MSITTVPSEETETPGNKEEGKAGAEFDVTIPLRVMREFERLLQKHPNPVVLNFSEDQVSLRLRNEGKETNIVARILQGAYPDYPVLLPPSFVRKITINRKALLACIERVGVFVAGKMLHCHFAVSEGDQRIAVSTETQDIGHGREAIDAQVTGGGDITYGFNIKYLLDVLRTAQSDEIELHGNAALAPVVFKPVGDPNVTFLMMPTQLRG